MTLLHGKGAQLHQFHGKGAYVPTFGDTSFFHDKVGDTPTVDDLTNTKSVQIIDTAPPSERQDIETGKTNHRKVLTEKNPNMEIRPFAMTRQI